MPLATLAEVFQFEKWLDLGIRDAMVAYGVITEEQYFLQFDHRTLTTQRIEVKSIPGSITQRQKYVLPDNQRTMYNTFDGRAELTAVTNWSDAKQTDHQLLLGQIRASLQLVSLTGNPGQTQLWPLYPQNALTLTDIYLDGDSLSTVDNENTLIWTKIPFALVFNILNSAIPLNI